MASAPSAAASGESVTVDRNSATAATSAGSDRVDGSRLAPEPDRARYAEPDRARDVEPAEPDPGWHPGRSSLVRPTGRASR